MDHVSRPRSAWWAILSMRCPRCRDGRIFRSLTRLQDPCPTCGLIFQREEGYFLGAMYVSTVLSMGLTSLFYVVWALTFGWLTWAAGVLSVVSFATFIPVVFRYSRVVWIWFDRYGSPGDSSA